ncbi:Thiol-disulfide isomerase or thioredoxin [Halovenus aranensis]|jgi:thiol-disulfide isomerase/thioredoxin|uniref:Thiol-disulfide isomerase or thioredoxin n=1 Tax=Halovenus aranensis TaxID=890420 RepID=A0A1G8Y3K8_9EURY|nr:TlpA disulfide reductase family protein [Halovenus aranensis]SDJ97459.1 Thiol-disulfide isomerase or thioredoxin [Halovenus aranensis]
MRRREALAGLGALGVFGGGAAVAFGGLDFAGGDGGVEPVELPRFEAPGSTAGTEVVPESDRVTFVTMFATWCRTCRREMDSLNDAAAAVPADVQFVSVTNEPIGETIQPADVVDWWREHDGNWPVAHDEDLELTKALDASGVPYSAVIDADNQLTWADGGYKETATILRRIDEAR